MSKKTFRAVIAIMLVIVVIAGAWFAGWQVTGELNPVKWFEGEFTEKNEDDNNDEGEGADGPIDEGGLPAEGLAENFSFAVENTPAMLLSLSPRAVTTANSVSKNVTVTVTDNVSNPKIDWTVEEMNGFSSSVANPVTVAPTSDGALTAVVTCSAAFTGNVLVRATLRDVGSTATCLVKFVGIPTSLSVSIPDYETTSDGFVINTTSSVKCYLTLDNVFHSVGDTYKDFRVTNVEKYGTLNVRQYYQYGSSWYGGGLTTIPFSEAINGYNGGRTYLGYSYGTVTNGVCSLSIYAEPLSYCDYTYTPDSGQFKDTPTRNVFYSMADPCYFLVTVQETVSGLSVTFKVSYSQAMGVVLDFENSEIEF